MSCQKKHARLLTAVLRGFTVKIRRLRFRQHSDRMQTTSLFRSKCKSISTVGDFDRQLSVTEGTRKVGLKKKKKLPGGCAGTSAGMCMSSTAAMGAWAWQYPSSGLYSV